jgi:hypothetical protein
MAVALGVAAGCVGLILLAVGRLTREPPNYSRVGDRLYMGGLVTVPPPGTRAVLNLCETPDPYQADDHFWEPIADAEPAPDLDWLRRMVEWVDARQRAGVTTYVHCRNGVSRSGMVVVAYEMSRNGWPRDRALEHVRSKRPEVRPNPAFMERLAEWERWLAGR